MSLVRVRTSATDESGAEDVVVAWRNDGLGSVRDVVVSMEGRILSPEPTRPGKLPSRFRTDDGRLVVVYVSGFPLIGNTPVVWTNGRWAAGTLDAWRASRLRTAVILGVVASWSAFVAGAKVLEAVDAGRRPVRPALAAAAVTSGLLAAGVALPRMWRGREPWIRFAWAAVALPIAASGLIGLRAYDCLALFGSLGVAHSLWTHGRIHAVLRAVVAAAGAPAAGAADPPPAEPPAPPRG